MSILGCCKCVFALFKFLCVVEIVMSSAYVISCVCLGSFLALFSIHF